MQALSEKTVSDIAIGNPAAIRVFEALGIDYCCGGRRSLPEACARAGLDPASVHALLDNVRPQGSVVSERWDEAPLSAVIGRIVERHHEYVRSEAPRIRALFQKVVARHGDKQPVYRGIQRLFAGFADELSGHMAREEQVLFPAILRLEEKSAGRQRPALVFPTLAIPIARMLAEHEDAGALLENIRALTNDYRLPPGACPTVHGLYQALEEFESDVRRHVHLENNILFPRAIALERAGGRPPR